MTDETRRVAFVSGAGSRIGRAAALRFAASGAAVAVVDVDGDAAAVVAAEIADIVFWLCSGAASYVVGQAIAVDGGYTAI